MRNAVTTLEGLRVLLAEDDWFIADDLVVGLQARGAEVIGPAASLEDALNLLKASPAIDAAVLDLDLRGQLSYVIADLLKARGIPIVFATGYGHERAPASHTGSAWCEKPGNPIMALERLFHSAPAA